tara:strand:- start:5276 stop:5470 length:195 start_codon:yes stop_codon:yes gene_type:complete
VSVISVAAILAAPDGRSGGCSDSSADQGSFTAASVISGYCSDCGSAQSTGHCSALGMGLAAGKS